MFILALFLAASGLGFLLFAAMVPEPEEIGRRVLFGCLGLLLLVTGIYMI